jgi:hypothetical protein
VEDWLRVFDTAGPRGPKDGAPDDESAFNPFPPGYGEDAFEEE